MIKNKLIMLIGLPGSGKTTYIRNMSAYINKSPIPFVVASTDNLIEIAALEQLKTYNEVFPSVIKEVTSQMLATVDKAIKNRENVLWDQTNLTAKTRASKLSKFPDCYFRQAVVIQCTTDAEWRHRLDNRPGKVIPKHVLESMAKTFEFPSLDEGFDAIEMVTT